MYKIPITYYTCSIPRDKSEQILPISIMYSWYSLFDCMTNFCRFCEKGQNICLLDTKVSCTYHYGHTFQCCSKCRNYIEQQIKIYSVKIIHIFMLLAHLLGPDCARTIIMSGRVWWLGFFIYLTTKIKNRLRYILMKWLGVYYRLKKQIGTQVSSGWLKLRYICQYVYRRVWIYIMLPWCAHTAAHGQSDILTVWKSRAGAWGGSWSARDVRFLCWTVGRGLWAWPYGPLGARPAGILLE